jgi:hypothetical protein
MRMMQEPAECFLRSAASSVSYRRLAQASDTIRSHQRAFSLCHNTTWNLLLGRFIGKDDALRAWLLQKTEAWEEAVADLASVAPVCAESHKRDWS